MARVKVSTPEPSAPPPSPLPSPAAIIETGAALVAELEKADKETTRAKARGVVFENANQSTEKDIDARYGALVERTFGPLDWNGVIDRYEAWLSLGERRTEEAFIRKAHEEGPSILQSLHDTYIQAKVAREEWELENDVMFGRMREAANESLQGEKARGVRSKQITEKDIDMECSRMFHDEWVVQESKRKRHKAVEDRLKACIEVAQYRCKGLDGMMAKLR